LPVVAIVLLRQPQHDCMDAAAGAPARCGVPIRRFGVEQCSGAALRRSNASGNCRGNRCNMQASLHIALAGFV
jgi:hypothetical protein